MAISYKDINNKTKPEGICNCADTFSGVYSTMLDTAAELGSLSSAISNNSNATITPEFLHTNNCTTTSGNEYINNTVYPWLHSYDSQPLNTDAYINVKTTDNNKENNNMKNFDFDFGSCENNSNIRLSIFGLAIKNTAGDWVSYDKNSGKIVDVDLFNIPNAGKYIFKMPCSLSAITEGDVIIHNRKPMFVCAVNKKANKITAIDIYAGEEKTILPTTSPFGFNFVTKIVTMFNMSNMNSANEQNPFGNMLPFLLFSEGKEIDPLMLMLIMNGQNGFNNFFNFGNSCGCQGSEPNRENVNE